MRDFINIHDLWYHGTVMQHPIYDRCVTGQSSHPIFINIKWPLKGMQSMLRLRHFALGAFSRAHWPRALSSNTRVVRDAANMRRMSKRKVNHCDAMCVYADFSEKKAKKGLSRASLRGNGFIHGFFILFFSLSLQPGTTTTRTLWPRCTANGTRTSLTFTGWWTLAGPRHSWRNRPAPVTGIHPTKSIPTALVRPKAAARAPREASEQHPVVPRLAPSP